TQDYIKNGRIIHIVQPKETLFSVSKKFKVTMQQIAELNHDAIDGLKIGEELIIPITSDNKDIAAEIKKLNKQKRKHDKETKSEIREEKTDTIFYNLEIPDSLKNTFSLLDSTPKIDSAAIKPHYNIAVFLPFFCAMNDTIEAHRKPSEPEKVYEKSKVALSFYRGLKAAIDTAQKMGLNASLKIYNTENSVTVTDSLLHLPEIDSVDVVIGPLFFSCLSQAVKKFKPMHKPIFVPVPQSNKILLDNENVFKIIPSDYIQIKEITRYITEKHKKDNILVINNYEGRYVQLVDIAKEEANKILHQTNDSLAQDSVKEIFFKDLKADKIALELDSTKENILIVPSVNQVFVSDLLTQLNLLDNYSITVVGTEKWKNWTNIDVNYFHKLKVHIPSAVYIDYDNPKTKKLIVQYLKNEYDEPNK
ncbi:MAG: LysM peptidoglycan-binding domain-containing protein, partial [Bacteroidetes bacterium]